MAIKDGESCGSEWCTLPLYYLTLFGRMDLVYVTPRVGPGYPISTFALPCQFTSSSFALYYFFPFFFSHSLYLFSSIVHPIPFYRNCSTLFPGVRL